MFKVGDNVRIVQYCANRLAGSVATIQSRSRSASGIVLYYWVSLQAGGNGDAVPVRPEDLEHINRDDIFVKLEQMLGEVLYMTFKIGDKVRVKNCCITSRNGYVGNICDIRKNPSLVNSHYKLYVIDDSFYWADELELYSNTDIWLMLERRISGA